MNKCSLAATGFFFFVALAAWSGAAIAKGGDTNPAKVAIDQNGTNNNVDVDSLPPVKIDPTQNGVHILSPVVTEPPNTGFERLEVSVIDNDDAFDTFTPTTDILIRTFDFGFFFQTVNCEISLFIGEAPPIPVIRRVFLDDGVTDNLSGNAANVSLEPGVFVPAGTLVGFLVDSRTIPGACTVRATVIYEVL